MNQRDLTGQTFGRLTAIERTNQKYVRCYLWRCACVCGGEKLVSTYALTHGTCKSCGCLQQENRENDITGQRFGRLIAVRRTGQMRHNTHVWECVCDCGNTTFGTTHGLTGGTKLSCGWHTDMARTQSEHVRDTNHVDGTNIGNITKLAIPAHNTSGCRGVSWHTNGLWIARLQFQGKQISLGYFHDINKPIEVRKAAEIKYYGAYLASKKDSQTAQKTGT